MREIFQRVEDGDALNIEVDMSAYGYSQKFSWLLSVFVKYDAQQGEDEAFEEFLETKESLIIALEHNEKAKYVGMRMLDGWSEFYFYADSSEDLDNIVSNMLKPSDYMYESNVVKDNKWNFHYKNLLPSDLELAHIQSEKIIFLLEEEEDDLEVVRPVEHYISFTTPTQKNRFVNTLDIEGVSFKDDIESDEFEHGIALVKEHSVTSDEVRKNVALIFEAVKKEKGFYEGWSTVLAKEVE
jgi:hypothetical protein